MNYRILKDGLFSTIVGCTENPDGYTVFSSFTKARKSLCDDLATEIDDLIGAKRRIRAMRASDVETEIL